MNAVAGLDLSSMSDQLKNMPFAGGLFRTIMGLASKFAENFKTVEKGQQVAGATQMAQMVSAALDQRAAQFSAMPSMGGR